MKIPLLLLALLGLAALILALISVYQRGLIILLRRRLRDSMHNSVEISNFLALFSRNLKTRAEFDNWMNVTARYVAELVNAQSVGIFVRDGDQLRAAGVSGPFPLLHKTSNYVMTKPKYILELLRRERIRIGEGILGTVAAKNQDIVMEDAMNDERMNLADPLVPIDCLMAVPLVSEGIVSGVMCAVNSGERDSVAFTSDQLARFKFISTQVVLAQNILAAYAHLSEQQRINQELEFARNLQKSLLPKSFPVWGRFSVQAFTRASKEVSGDFYDFVQIDDDRLLIVIGDACGKGVPACMIMFMTRSFIRSNIDRFTSLKDLLLELNDNLYRDTGDERYITLGCCLLNRHDMTLEYARGGHTELLVYVREHIRVIYPDGSALGILPSELSDFDCFNMEFTPTMSVLMFTDGVNEATSPKTGEYFGVKRLTELYKDSCLRGDSPEDLIYNVINTVDTFAETPNGEGQEDDQTMVIIRHI